MTRRTRPLAIDLFCCAGGAAVGLHRAGFDVIGFDVKPSRQYPFPVFEACALEADLDQADFVWASPPCQAHIGGMRAVQAKRYGRAAPEVECFIERTRALLEASGKPYCIENVPGAPLRDWFALDGNMFGLGIVRRRHFEANFPVLTPQAPIRARTRRGMVTYGHEYVPVSSFLEALGVPHYMNDWEARQAIPPAYSEFIARQALACGAVQ